MTFDYFQGDPGILITVDGATIVFKGGQPVMDQGLENQALIALLTEKGWPGNFLFDDNAQNIGSDFEKLARGPITLSTLSLIEKTAEDALKSDIFGTVAVEASNPESWRTEVKITIEPPGNDVSTILLAHNGQNWINQAANPAHKRYERINSSLLLWDFDVSDEEVDDSSSAVVAVIGEFGPFTWSVSGTGFSMQDTVTEGLTNQLNADGSACGTATITVSDSRGGRAVGYVRSTDAVNSEWVVVATGLDAYGIVVGDYDTFQSVNYYKVQGRHRLWEAITWTHEGLDLDATFNIAPDPRRTGDLADGCLYWLGATGCADNFPRCSTNNPFCNVHTDYRIKSLTLYEWRCK